MAVKKLSQRVDDAFDDAGAQRFADKYLDSVLESYQSAADGLRRTVILVAVLVLAFFLLEHAKSGAFEIGPLHLSNVAAVLTLIPAILSLQYIELAALATAGMRLEKLRDALFARLYPSIARESLDKMLGPVRLQAWGEVGWREVRTTEESRITRTLDVLDAVAFSTIFLGALAFTVYAFGHLFHDPKASTVTVAISLGFTVVNMVRAALLLWDEAQATG